MKESSSEDELLRNCTETACETKCHPDVFRLVSRNSF